MSDPANVSADLIAGISVALVLVPQSMAYAQLAGLPPHAGLYAAFLPPIVAAVFGSSRQLATGPVAMVSLMTAAALTPMALGGDKEYLALAVVLAVLIGGFQLAFGLLRLGVVVKLLTHPVILGFTYAGALIIATSQFDKVFGVAKEPAAFHFLTVGNVLWTAWTDTHLPTLAIGVLALGLMLGLRRLAPRLPAVLIAVSVTTLVAWLTGFDIAGGAVVGVVPAGLPPFELPTLHAGLMVELAVPALVISIVGFMEAIAIAKAVAAHRGQTVDVNRELIGQGLANLSAGVTAAFPVSGSFSRTAVNADAGAETGLSSVVSGLMVAGTLLWLTPLFFHLPEATLAMVIIFAVLNLMRPTHMAQLEDAGMPGMLVFVTTFGITVLIAPHIEYGILAGVALDRLLALRKRLAG